MSDAHKHPAALDLVAIIDDKSKGKVVITEAFAHRLLKGLATLGWHVVGPHTGRSFIYSTSLHHGITKEDLRESFEDAISDLRIKDRHERDDDERDAAYWPRGL